MGFPQRWTGAVLAVLVAAGSPAAAGEIRGRIVMGERPAAGVTVAAVPYETPDAEARRQARRGPAPLPLATAATRPDGSFAVIVPAAPGGTFRLLAEGAGAMPAWVGGIYDASETDLLGEHALLRAEMLAGKVVSAGGTPVAGAAVTVIPAGDALGGDPDVLPVARTVTTGADGVFRAGEASPAGNRVTVVAKGFGAASIGNVRAGAMPRPIVVGLGALVSGVVARSDGKAPAAAALVRFEAEGLETAWVEAGPDGRFELGDLPLRPGLVVADGGDLGLGQAATGPLPLAAARRITVVLSRPPALEGRVLDARTRAPVPRARVTVEDGTRTRTARSGPDGRYEVRGLMAARAYRLRADEPRYTPYVRDGLLLASAERLRMDVPLRPGASLSGRVVDEGGRPVAGALGRLVPSREGGFGTGPRILRGGDRLVFRTAADGTFDAKRLAPGDNQRLTVVHPEFEPRTTAGLSLAGGEVKTLTIVLRRGLALVGRVRDEAGRPVADAAVAIGPGRGFGLRGVRGAGAAPGTAARSGMATGSDGRFEVKGLGEGDYAVTVSKAGYADHRLDRVPVDSGRRDPLEITLVAGAAIRGAVVRPDGRGAEGYWVRAVEANSSGPGFGPLATGDLRPTGPDGAFEIPGLRAGGTYDVVLLGPDGVGSRREDVDAPGEVEIVVRGPGAISGRVVDAQTLSPIQDFQVDFAPDRSSGRSGAALGAGRVAARMARAAAGEAAPGPQAVHSEDGGFVLESVPAGTWEVVARAKGYQPARVGGIAVEEGSAREGVEIRLSAGNIFRGRVLDAATGAPVLDASVTLQRAGGGGRGLAMLLGQADARTDGDGAFAIDGMAAGAYAVVAQHPDYAQATALVEVKEGGATAELRMQSGGILAGTVVSEGGAPVPGATVTVSAGGAEGGSRLGGFDGPSTMTDDAGRFRFTHVTAGRYAVAASSRGQRAPAIDVVVQAGESRQGLVLLLGAGARIQGTVSGLPPDLRGNVRVTAGGADGYSASTVAAADGSFEVTGAPPGPVTLRAYAIDPTGTLRRSATGQVSIAEGQADAIAQIVFEAGYSLSGTVTRRGEPVEGVILSASRDGTSGSVARTDASGAYRLEGLSEGAYHVMVLSGGATPRTQLIEIAGDATLDLVIPFARIGGTVLDAATRQPVADAVVQAAVREPARGPKSATTDSNGRFSLEDLDTGPYTLIVRKAGYQLETREVTPAETATDDIVFELTRGGGLGLEVRDASLGLPLRVVQVRVTHTSGAAAFAGTVPLDADGRGEVPSLPPGGHVVAVYAPGYAPAILSVTAPAARVAVPVEIGGALEIRAGTATLARGTARVHLLTAGGQPYPFAFSAPEGRVTLSLPIRRIENLAPGRYVLQPEQGEGRPFEVQPAGLTTVALP